MGSLTDIDFSGFDLDAPVGELTTNGQQGTLKRFLEQGKHPARDRAQLPLRPRGPGRHARRRSPPQMAEVIQEVGGDGFVFTGGLTRRYVSEITDGLLPALQRMGWCAPPTSTSTSAIISCLLMSSSPSC